MVSQEYMNPEKTRDLAYEVLYIGYKTRHCKYTKTTEKKRIELIQRLAELENRKSIKKRLDQSYHIKPREN
jgi:hypothetical protein